LFFLTQCDIVSLSDLTVITVVMIFCEKVSVENKKIRQVKANSLVINRLVKGRKIIILI
jgi:hypothetical protein